MYVLDACLGTAQRSLLCERRPFQPRTRAVGLRCSQSGGRAFSSSDTGAVPEGWCRANMTLHRVGGPADLECQDQRWTWVRRRHALFVSRKPKRRSTCAPGCASYWGVRPEAGGFFPGVITTCPSGSRPVAERRVDRAAWFTRGAGAALDSALSLGRGPPVGVCCSGLEHIERACFISKVGKWMFFGRRLMGLVSSGCTSVGAWGFGYLDK